MSRHLLLAGAGHAHLGVLAHLEDFLRRGHRVTVVSPQPEHPYSGMGPGLLGGFYLPQEILLPVRALTERHGGTFRRDRVCAIDAEARRVRLASGETLGYDVLSCNLGSGVRREGIALGHGGWRPAKPVDELVVLRHDLPERLGKGCLKLLVVGGGPTGVELAGNLWRLARQANGPAAITLVAGSRLLAGYPPRARRLALASLRGRGIEVLEGVRVTALEPGRATLDGASPLPCDEALLATGVTPPDLFATSGLPTGAAGGLRVGPDLSCPSHPEIFGGGDCIDFGPAPLARVGVHAIRQGPILRRNLLAALEERSRVPYRPQRRCLLILNLGDGRGIACRGRWALGGRVAFRLKDRIDRGFMARYRTG